MRVRGEGPSPADVMLVGEAPGRDEDLYGRPFVGKSGKELARYLSAHGLGRSDIYITNIVKERPPFIAGKQHPPSAADIARDEGELYEEILKVRPLWIGAVGRVSARWFLGNLDMESAHGLPYPLPDPEGFVARIVSAVLRGNSQAGGGMALEAVSWARSVRIVPIYHPAAALHNADIAPLVQWDIQQFAGYVTGSLPAVTPRDDYPVPSYSDTSAGGLRPLGMAVAIDTEGLAGSPWGLSLTDEAGRASVVRYASAGPDTQFGGVARALEGRTLIFQNAPHDVPILAEMGIPVDWSRVEDTYFMSYCLRLTPMGLKAMARRFCGMEMQSYRDVIAPADRRLAMEWVERALAAKTCPLCDGVGKLQELNKKGDAFKKGLVRCWYPGCVDGGMWPQRSDTGWSVGRYLKRLRDDIEKGTFSEEIDDDDDAEVPSVRKRVGSWPSEVLGAVAAEIGPLSEPTLDDIDPVAATYYSARDADATFRVYPWMRRQIDQLELEEAYRLDLSVMPAAMEMMRTGMRIDTEYFASLSAELREENRVILEKLERLVERPINPASGDQVADLLYGGIRVNFDEDDVRDYVQFDIEPEKRTKSGKRGATDDKVLEGLKLKYAGRGIVVEVIDLILDYRMRDKILGTYAEKLPLMVDGDSRVHTEIKPCRTATFRWASANPNLQNIPIRKKGVTDLGKRVRQGFVASPGYILGSWDFDQIEMRVLAWFSQERRLLDLFEGARRCPVALADAEGKCDCHDIHTLTASLVFRVPTSEVTKDQRTSAKNIGFGIVYGVTAKGLKAQMELRGQHWTLEECQSLIDRYLHDAYPGVGRFMADAHAEARSTGMVRSYFGHIRYTPNVHSSIPSIREEALRQAANFKIQCTAAELLKVAIRDLWSQAGQVLSEMGVRWLMAVHDELLFEVPDNPDTIAAVDTIVTAFMTNPVRLDGVHIGTSGKFAYHWGKLK